MSLTKTLVRRDGNLFNLFEVITSVHIGIWQTEIY